MKIGKLIWAFTCAVVICGSAKAQNVNWAKDGNSYYYFDSFGFSAPQEIEDRIGDYTWSNEDIQSFNNYVEDYFDKYTLEYSLN